MASDANGASVAHLTCAAVEASQLLLCMLFIYAVITTNCFIFFKEGILRT